MSRNPIYDQPSAQERAAFERRRQESLARVRRPGPVETWIGETASQLWSAATTPPRPNGVTSFSDAQMAERRRQERAQEQAAAAAVAARRERDNQERLADLARSNQRAGRPLNPQLEAALAASNARRAASSSAETTRTSAVPAANTGSSSSSSTAPPAQERTGGSGETPTSSSKLKDATFRQSVTPQVEGNTANVAFGVSRTQRDQFDISRFRSSVISEDSVLPTHSFLVVFAPMPWALDYMDTGVTATTLTMRCDNAILPSLNLLQEQNIRRYGYGPVENVAYGVNVGDFTLQFIVDKEAQQFDFFEAWLNKIVNRDSYGGANMNPTQGPTPYEIAYKDTYACSSINVFVYDRAQNTVLEYNIYDAYPTGIQSMNMSWSEENTLMKLNVNFTFTDFRIRPKISAFNQGAGTINGRSTLTPQLQAQLDEEARARAIAEEQLRSALGNQNPTGGVVIGEGNNGVPRTFGAPTDTGPQVTPQPAVYIPKTKNAFGTQLQST